MLKRKKKTVRRPNRIKLRSTATNAYELLEEVRKLILAEPKRYNQNDWLRRGIREIKRCDLLAPVCNTVGCVAGWVVTLKKKISGIKDFTEYSPRARKILGLDWYQSGELFSGTAADGKPQTVRHARSGAKHIREFMLKNADQLKATKV